MEGREREARECYEGALALDPTFDEAHYEIGCMLPRSGDYEGAVKSLRKALEGRSRLRGRSRGARHRACCIQ